jgi:hypothetical protein
MVHVQWVDSMRTGGWRSRNEAVEDFERDDLACESVGFLLAENDERVMICRDRSARLVDDTMIIPRVAIRSVKELK